MNKIKVNSYTQFFNYALIAYYILWAALQKIFSLPDAAGRTGWFLCAFAVVLNLRNTGVSIIYSNKAVRIWAVWTIVAAVNWLIQGYNTTMLLDEHPLSNPLFIYRNMFLPVFLLAISVHESKQDVKSFSFFVLLTFALYIFVGVFFGGGGESKDEMRDVSVIGNMLPLTSLSLLFVAFFVETKEMISKKILYIIIIITFYSIIAAATRKAFGAGLLILGAWIIAKNDLLNPRKIILLILMMVAAYFCVSFILDNTYLGTRFVEESSDQNRTDYEWLNFLGDRAIMYVAGYELFLSNPLFGIGITNFRIFGGLNGLMIHSEFVVQLCECGIIGSILYLLFYVVMIKGVSNIDGTDHINKQSKIVFLGYIGAILFVSLTAWTYSMVQCFVCFGIIVGCSDLYKKDSLLVN